MFDNSPCSNISTKENSSTCASRKRTSSSAFTSALGENKFEINFKAASTITLTLGGAPLFASLLPGRCTRCTSLKAKIHPVRVTLDNILMLPSHIHLQKAHTGSSSSPSNQKEIDHFGEKSWIV